MAVKLESQAMLVDRRGPLEGKRILFVSALFPPDVMGGAELSAYNLARWLASRGADVGVLTTARKPKEELRGDDLNGLKTWRVWMPRPYPMWEYPIAPMWKKPLWHLQDHFDPRNKKIAADVLAEFEPDLVSIHIIQGLGYNMLGEIGVGNIPTVFFLHDLGLGCFRMSMFRKGRNCASQCALCKVSSLFKRKQCKTISNLAFCSPSAANLDTLASVFPVKEWPSRVLLNANRYPPPSVECTRFDVCRLLYAGRLHSSKGVAILLEACESIVKSGRQLQLTIAGSGPEEMRLKERFSGYPWVKFLGFISQEQLSNEMVRHEFLCIPSIWAENSPGVVIHALSLGVPVIGSSRGGIPELVRNNDNGLLVEDCSPASWRSVIERVVEDRTICERLRARVATEAFKYAQEYTGLAIEEYLVAALARQLSS